MNISQMNDTEFYTILCAHDILGRNSQDRRGYSFEDYDRHIRALDSLDEEEIISLGELLNIKRGYTIYTMRQADDLIHFLDHPESRLKNFVRYER